jgi:hypothetical protein
MKKQTISPLIKVCNILLNKKRRLNHHRQSHIPSAPPLDLYSLLRGNLLNIEGY